MLKNKQFIYLTIGQSSSNLADILYIVSLLSIIYSTTKSAFLASIVTFIMTIAIFVSGVLSPILLNKYQLNDLLTYSQLFKTILLGCLLLYVSFVDNLAYYIILIFVIFISFLDGFANPIKRSLIPYYVIEDDLLKANSLSNSIDEVIQIGSWVLGGTLLVWLSPSNIIALSFSLYITATIFFKLLERIALENKNKEKESIFTQTKEGFSLFIRSPILRKFLIMDTIESIASTVWISSILLVYVSEVLNENDTWWGYINAMFFTGMISMGIIMYKWNKTVKLNMKFFILFGILLTSFSTFIFGFTTTNVIALISSLMVGIGAQLKGIPIQVLFQTVAPKEKLPILYAAEGTILTPLFGVSSLAIGITADKLGVQSIFYFSSGCLLIVFFIAWRLLSTQSIKQ